MPIGIASSSISLLTRLSRLGCASLLVFVFHFSVSASEKSSSHQKRVSAAMLKPISPQPAEFGSEELEVAPSEFSAAAARGPASVEPNRTKSAEPQKAASTPAANSIGRSITRVVGEVGESSTLFITSREVRINDVIEQAVFGRLPGMTEVRVLRGTEKNFAKHVQEVLREWVIFLEARAFDSTVVSDEEMSKSLNALNASVGKLPEWRALEPTPSEVSEILKRKLIAKRFLSLKSESAYVPISESEAMAYFQKNRLKFGNLPFSSFRDNIKSFLSKQQMDRRLEDWIEVLEKKHRVRNFIAG